MPVIPRELKSEKDKESIGIVVRGIQYFKILGNNRISEVVIQTVSPKKELGFHYHLRKIEWFVPLRGRAKLFWHDNADRKRQIRVEVMDGDSLLENPKIFEVKPNTCHFVRNEADTYFLMLALTNIPDVKDVKPCPIKH